MRPGQRTLLCESGLIAFLEPTTVRNTPKHAWDKLRIVNQTKPREHLIFLAEIHIQPGVKRVAVLTYSR